MVQFTLEEDGLGQQTLTCVFLERLDTDNCMQCSATVHEKIQDANSPVVFDLHKIDYVASSFLSMCLRVVQNVGKDNFSIINLHPNVKRVFKIAGFDRQINIV